jgi:Galactose oxidase, central domain/Kelch motif
MNGIKPQGKPWTQEANHKTYPRGKPRGILRLKKKKSNCYIKKLFTRSKCDCKIKILTMKKIMILSGVFTVLTLVAFKKDTTTDTPKELIYTGTSEVLSEGRYNINAVQTGNYTCFVSGSIFTLNPFGLTTSNNIDVYNQQTNAWARYGITPNRRAFAVVAKGTKLVIAGGHIPANNTYNNNVDIIDLESGITTRVNLSQARQNIAAATTGNKMIFAGGNSSSLSAVADIYDVTTNQWSTAALSQARTGISAGAAGNKIVFAGGVTSNNTFSDKVDIYDVQTNQWSATSLSQPKAFLSVIATGNKIFFAGGATNAGTYSENVDVYDVQTNQWSVITLTQNKIPVSVCSNGNYLVFSSGSNYINQRAEQLFIYNLNNSQVKSVALPAAHGAFAMAAVGNKVIMAGGTFSDGYTKKVIVYDLVSGVFDSTSLAIPDKLIFASAITSGSKILVAGGNWDGTNTAGAREIINYKTVSVFELK